jgi:hypothetical protein
MMYGRLIAAGTLYALQHDETTDEWESAAFTASRKPATP